MSLFLSIRHFFPAFDDAAACDDIHARSRMSIDVILIIAAAPSGISSGLFLRLRFIYDGIFFAITAISLPGRQVVTEPASRG